MIIIGFVILGATLIWYIYRIVKGWLRLNEGQPIVRVSGVSADAVRLGTHQPWIWLEDLEGQAHRGQRPFGQSLRVEQSAGRCGSRASRCDDADQIAIALGCARRTRHEATFLQARIGAAEDKIACARCA